MTNEQKETFSNAVETMRGLLDLLGRAYAASTVILQFFGEDGTLLQEQSLTNGNGQPAAQLDILREALALALRNQCARLPSGY